ncbi:radical SAM protein [Archangium violaceum]|uniref:B12-binding domain-containing radical SAM protein n=1 Tax=Archangium violaceum TaxID=83451 RepID=UPI002B2B24D4|nr:radical SAM protein [Archangium violaceum]
MKEKVVVLMPKLGHTTGEMPHMRNPPKNYMPGQMLYYLYTACRNLGCDVKVIDVNWSIDPFQEVMDFGPDKLLISTATPTFQGTLETISTLRARGYHKPIFVGGPHVSLNAGMRDWLLPSLEGVTYIPIIKSSSTFDWVPTVFPERTQFEVLGMPDAEARKYIVERLTQETGKEPNLTRLEPYLFSYFVPSMDWVRETYYGEHIRPEMKQVPFRHSIITSIGCSKTCSFCGNPYIYRIGFKSKEVVRDILRDFKRNGVDRLSVADMFFVMHMPHTQDMMDVFKEEGMQYSMQTCLENLTDELFVELKASGLRKCLVGIENPVSYSVGKRVEMNKLRWLLDTVQKLELEGAKLSYIVGLPGVELEHDLALLDHVVTEILSRNHPLEDLQVNLYTPYRPEGDTVYFPYGEEPPPHKPDMLKIQILNRIPFSYWGSFPVGIASGKDFWRQLVLCDLIYDQVYADFREVYLGVREQYVAEIRATYPSLAPHIPTFEDSRSVFSKAMRRRSVLEKAIGNDEGRGRRVAPPMLAVGGAA